MRINESVIQQNNLHIWVFSHFAKSQNEIISLDKITSHFHIFYRDGPSTPRVVSLAQSCQSEVQKDLYRSELREEH